MGLPDWTVVFFLTQTKILFLFFLPGWSLHPEQQCAVSMWKKRSSYTYLFLFISLPGLFDFLETQQSPQWGTGPPQPLTLQCRRWSAGNLLGLKGCILVLSQWDDVIQSFLLDGFKNTLEKKLRPIPFSWISSKIEAFSVVLSKG